MQIALLEPWLDGGMQAEAASTIYRARVGGGELGNSLLPGTT